MNIRFLIGKGRKRGRETHRAKLGELFPSDIVWDISFPQGRPQASRENLLG